VGFFAIEALGESCAHETAQASKALKAACAQHREKLVMVVCIERNGSLAAGQEHSVETRAPSRRPVQRFVIRFFQVQLHGIQRGPNTPSRLSEHGVQLSGAKSLASANEARGSNLEHGPAAADRGEAFLRDQVEHPVRLGRVRYIS
jgi:hypothetical protein